MQDGVTAMDIARAAGHADIVELFQQYTHTH